MPLRRGCAAGPVRDSYLPTTCTSRSTAGVRAIFALIVSRRGMPSLSAQPGRPGARSDDAGRTNEEDTDLVEVLTENLASPVRREDGAAMLTEARWTHL